MLKENRMTQQESDFPTGLSAPAKRALDGAGYVRKEHLSRVSEAELKKLHGVGPNAINLLRRALDAKGLSFAERKSSKE
jgi:hypothetical protein